MINIFTFKDNTRYPAVRSPRLDINYKYLRNDYEHIDIYYKNRESVVSNTNIFTRLIKNISVNIDKDLFSYIDLIDISSTYVAKSLKITSTLSKGEVFTNLFGTSVSLLHDTFISPFEAENYNEVSAINVLYSDSTDLGMSHPSNIETGIFVLQIDVVAIMVQYRKWALDRIQNEMNTNPNVFVYQVLYTNMIKDILELNLFNRFFKNIFSEDSKRTHPFSTRDLDNVINNAFMKSSSDLKNKTLRYVELLRNIPMPFHKDAYEVLFYGSIPMNQQNSWAIFISRIEYILNIINFLGIIGVRRNRDSLVNFSLFMKVIRFNRVLNMNLKTIEPKITVLYNEALRIAKKRGL